MSAEARRLAFVVPYATPGESFFPDTLLSWMSARARRLGHETRLVRVYYEGNDAGDAEVRGRLSRWLDAFAPTHVLVERTFDLEPLLAVREAHGTRLVMVCRGDGFDPDPRLDGWIGRAPGLYRGRTRRSPTVSDLLAGLDAMLDGRDPPERSSSVLAEVELDLAHDVIALDPAAAATPRVRTVLGNAGCPYAGDPRDSSFYVGALLTSDEVGTSGEAGARGGPALASLSLLGCAFCPMGGDYQATPHDALVPFLAAQARAIRAAAPETAGFVLSDQAPLPYLAKLVEETRELAPVRWLFAARADTFLRERARLERALAVAAQHGHVLELYLTGFESFSDAELARYVKGVTAAELVDAVRTMRELAASYPDTFGYGNERGHSLILWSPWTSPDELSESLDTIRREGLRELFFDLGRNRLRLTHELPITRAAERDGALVPGWPDDDEGAARGKGYSPERPWRFLDARTALAHRMAERLRARLGRETELAQLRAAVAWARSAPEARQGVDAVLEAVERLDAALGKWLRGTRGSAEPPRASFVRAAVLDSGMRCGCGRAACAERDVWVNFEGATARLGDVLAEGPRAVLLAGGDAVLHPSIVELTATVRARALVGLAMPSPHEVPAGISLDALVVDVGGEADVAALVPGVSTARTRSPALALEARMILDHTIDAARGRELAASVARALRPEVLRVVAPLDGVGLDGVDGALAALGAIAEIAAAQALPFEVSPLAAGPAWRERVPVRRGPEPSGR